MNSTLKGEVPMDVSIPLSSTPKNEALSGRRAQTASAAIEIQ
jgi:hypothetical protein